MAKLSDFISVNKDFRSAVNLYLHLNKKEKLSGYIPTNSSLRILYEYLTSFAANKEQATLLVGPYGKGKSYLLLILLAIISMKRNEENTAVIQQIISKIDQKDRYGEVATEQILNVWKEHRRILPVLISGNPDNLDQAFLYGLNDALKREGLMDLAPDSFYSKALERIDDWKESYPDTYETFGEYLAGYNIKPEYLEADLRAFSRTALDIFKEVYPRVTSGSTFNPMAEADVLPLYKNVAQKLCDECEYEGIYIVFDEFSKFIESQNGVATGNNMKLLQDMCELAADSPDAKIFITMVAHKSIKEYGKYLSQEIINSFTGIEGRITEKFFVTSSKNNYELIKKAIIKQEHFEMVPAIRNVLTRKNFSGFYQIPFFKSDFSESDFDNLIFKGCYPLSPVSSYLLLNISEKVAQNERTLFTFISNEAPDSMARYIDEHEENMPWQIDTARIYDYFSPLFKKEIVNEHVHHEWLNAEYAVSKCDTEDQIKVVKALALILIVNNDSELPAVEDIVVMASGVVDGSSAISELVDKGLIYKKGATNSYVFRTRAGTELKTEIRRQRELRGDNINYSKVLTLVTGKHYIVPRRYNTDNWMTRYFIHEYMKVEDFLEISDASVLLDDAIDGKVISLYTPATAKLDTVKKHTEKLGCKKLIIIKPKRKFGFSRQILDLEIIQSLKADATFADNNEILKRELPLMEEDLSAEILKEAESVYGSHNGAEVYWYDGSAVVTYDAGKEESAVNDACLALYNRCPRINNEMINRHAITTGQTRRARLNVVGALLSHSDEESFYSGTSQEATIYRALLVNTGIRSSQPDGNFEEILRYINDFIISCSDQRRSVSSLIQILTGEPYGMRAAVIPVYLAYALSVRREDIIIYFAGMEVQLTADIVINMCEKPSDYELFVSKVDVEKEKYVSRLNELFDVKDNRNLSENRIKNIYVCMQRWFRTLPQVTRNAVDFAEYISDREMVRKILLFKKLLQRAEANPYEILFQTIPGQVDNNDLEKAFTLTDSCKTLLDDYYDWLVNKVVEVTRPFFADNRKIDLHHALKEWYDRQSSLSRQGLHSGRITNFMSCIDHLNVYNDAEVAKKIVKAATDIYIDNWNDNSLEEYSRAIIQIKQEVESIRKSSMDGKMRLLFVGRNGEDIERYYTKVDEGTGTVLRNVIEDTLEEFDDLSVNDRVAILLEMIEKIIGQR